MGKREDILNATLDLISEEGLQAVSFAKILKRANVGSGTVYNYFKNKEEIVSAIFIQVSEHLNTAALQGYDPAQSVHDCFCRILTNMANFAKDNPKDLWFLENFSHSPAIPEEIRSRDNDSFDECIRLIRRGQEQGIIRAVNPLLLVQMTAQMVIAAVQGALLGKYPLSDTDFAEVLDICWRAIVI